MAFESGCLLGPTNEKIDLVYNRHTDFYFEAPSQAALRKAFESNAACFSPNPHEYKVLADKERLLELSQNSVLDGLSISSKAKTYLQSTILESVEITKSNSEEIWASRKKYYFKPRRSHGGKAVYRGASISKVAFSNLLNGEFIAQEFAPPSTISLPAPAQTEEYKYDLRFYAYRDKIQLASARFYQGQMTNARTPGGGTAPIRWVD